MLNISLSLCSTCLTSPLHLHSCHTVSCSSLCLGWHCMRALEGENNKSERREDVHERNRLEHVWLLLCRGSGCVWSLCGVRVCMVMLKVMALDTHGCHRAWTWACVIVSLLRGHKGPLSGHIIVTQCPCARITIMVWCRLHRGSGPTWLLWCCGSVHMWLPSSGGHVCMWLSLHDCHLPGAWGLCGHRLAGAWGPHCHCRAGALHPCFRHHPVSGCIVVVMCWPCGCIVMVAGGTLAMGPLWPRCHCCVGAVPPCFGHCAQVLWTCCCARAWSPVSHHRGAGQGRACAHAIIVITCHEGSLWLYRHHEGSGRVTTVS